MIALKYTPPYDWSGILNFLRPRAIAGVETVTDDAYERDGVRVTHNAARNAVIASDEAARVRTMFDVDADIVAIEKHFARDATLGPLVRKYPGIRVPGTWDPFEMAIRAIVGQQSSVAGPTTLVGRSASRKGVTRQSLMRGGTKPGAGVERHRPAGAAGEIERRLRLGRITVVHLHQQTPHGAEVAFAEGLVVGVGECTGRLGRGHSATPANGKSLRRFSCRAFRP